MAMCDYNYKFVYINIGAKRNDSNGGVFTHCTLARKLFSNELELIAPRPLGSRSMNAPFVILADYVFPFTNNIMKPYPQRNLSIGKRMCNCCLSRGR